MNIKQWISAITIASVPGAALAGEVNVLTWEGYADDSFIKGFEESSSCTVNPTYVGSNDDFAPKLVAGGGVYDLITPSIDTTALMIDAGFVEPLDTSRITEWDNIYPKFLALEGIQRDGEYYGMPYTWGSIPYMYRVDKFDTPPTTMADVFAPELAGKVSLWDDKSSLYTAARMNGDMNVYDLTDDQLAAARDKMVELKPMVRKYWATAGELVDLYVGGEVWVSNTWGGYQSNLIAEQGIEVAEFIPAEGAEGWMDSWMMVKGTSNTECAYKLLNFLLSAEGQCGVANVNGYSVANPVAAKACMPAEQFATLHQDDPDYLDSLQLWEPLGDRFGDYTNAWNSVKSQ